LVGYGPKAAAAHQAGIFSQYAGAVSRLRFEPSGTAAIQFVIGHIQLNQ
jgi:hypothetical protein